MSWAPDPTMLGAAVQLLQHTMTPGVDQSAVQTSINRAKHNPEFTAYLVYILANPDPSSPLILRQTAGLLAKNTVRDAFTAMAPPTAAAVKAMVLQGLKDVHPEVHSTAKNIVGTIARLPLVIEEWPELFKELVRMLKSAEEREMGIALATLSDVCEDLGSGVDLDRLGRPLNYLFPEFIKFMAHPNAAARTYALKGALHVMGGEEDDIPAAIISNAEAYMRALSALTSDPDAGVRRLVCQCLIVFVEKMPEHLSGVIDTVVAFFLHVCKTDTYEVKLAAVEFWSVLCEAVLEEGPLGRSKPGPIVPQFPVLIPTLVELLVLSEDEKADLPVDDVDDSRVPDKPEEIRPFQYHVRNDDDPGDPSTVEQWTVRRAAAAALDSLATTFEDQILPPLMATLDTCFKSPDDALWPAREAGMMALGAVSDGCSEGLVTYFSRLIPFIVSMMADRRPLVRAMSCWTLSRYSLVLSLEPPLFNSVLDAIINTCADHTKKVQEQACTALCAFLTTDAELIKPHLAKLLAVLGGAFGSYQTKNMLVLYDTVGTLAENLDSLLRDKTLSPLLLEPIIRRWNSLPDDDEVDLPPLMECLAFVVTALKEDFAPFAPEVMKRSMSLLENTLVLVMAARAVPGEEEPGKTFIVAAVDMLAALAEALGPSFEPLLGPNVPKLFPMLWECCTDPARDVRQSTLALIGDTAVSAFVHLRPHMDQVMSLVLPLIDPQMPKVCNNACWAVGEIALRLGPDMAKYAPAVRDVIAQKLISPPSDGPAQLLQRSVYVNAAVTMSRVAMQVPAVIAANVAAFLFNWMKCSVLVTVPAEKAHAYIGVCAAIGTNPKAAEPFLQHLLPFLLNYDRPTEDVVKIVNQMFGAIKAAIGPALAAVLTANTDAVQPLQAKYGATLFA